MPNKRPMPGLGLPKPPPLPPPVPAGPPSSPDTVRDPIKRVPPPGVKPPTTHEQDPYQQSVDSNLQYLTAQQRTEVMQRQQTLTALKGQAKAAEAKLTNLANLRTKGAQGVRTQQSLLRNAGYNIAVDGQYGKQTEAALRDYVTKQENSWNDKLTQQATVAHPVNVRAEANAKIPVQKVKNDRAFILSYAVSQQAQLRTALQQAEAEVNRGAAGASDKVKNIRDTIGGLEHLRQVALDPVNGLDPTTLDDTMRKIVESQKQSLQQQNKAAKSGGGLLHEIESTAFGVLDKLTLNVFNRGSEAFAAAFETKMQTGSLLKAAQAAIGGFTSFIRVPDTDISLVGLIAPGGSDARKYIEESNSNAEMEAAVKEGKLLSIGQTITGDVTPQFQAANPDTIIGLPSVIKGVPNAKAAYAGGQQEAVKGFDPASAIADLGALPFKDPTIIAGELLEPLREFGNVDRIVNGASKEALAKFGEDGVMKLARTVRLSNTVTGRALMSSVSDAIERSGSAFDLEKAIPGLDHAAALTAMAAKEAENGGIEAATNVLRSAFTDGRWNPKISLVRQITNDLANRVGLIGDDGIGKLGLEASVGRAAVKASDRLAFVRMLATPKDDIAATYERNAVTFTDEAVAAAANAEHSTVSALWRDGVADSVKGLDSEARFYNVSAAIYSLNNHALQDAFDGYMRPFFRNTDLLDSVPLSSYMEAVFNQDSFDQALQKVETLAAIASGKAGPDALKQFNADVARGFLLPKNAGKTAFQNAVQNVGLKLGTATKGATRKDVLDAIHELPAKDQTYFRDRLLALKSGKAGLGRLAKDVDLAVKNPQLREELANQLERQQGRAAQFAEAAPEKAGLGRRIAQSPAKLILSNTDVVPPTELRFKYDTPNELYHSQLRAKAATRYLQAFNVPANVQATLIRSVETVQTEEQFFNVVERMTRAALESKGIENPEGVMSLLRTRGDFSKVLTKPVRTIIDGEPVEDLQTLAQRIETARLYSPAEVAAATRKAILDGTEDASTARRLAATVRVEVTDRLGNMNLHFTDLNGKEVTLKSGAKSLHRMWKFLIVTNAGMPVIGAAAGFIGTQGTIGDKLHNAGLGFALGAAGSTRYIFRVVGLEDRIRMLLDQGFTADMHMPAWAKLQSRRYSEDALRRTLSDDIVRLGNYGTNHLDNELLSHIDPDWVSLDRKASRANDAWYRIVNHQIHPESDPVMAILLREQAGHLGGDEDVTRVVKVLEDEKPRDLTVSTTGATDDTRSDFQKQMDAYSTDIIKSGNAPVRTTNEDLLADFAGKDKKAFYRGEDGTYPNRGDGWIPESYNKGKGEQYARNFAGEDGHVYKVELPVDEHVPLVGEIASEGNLGWVLAGENSHWADAADEMLPNGSAATAGDQATYKTVTEKRTITAAEDADRQIADFLSTEEGALWQERWKGAIGGTGNPNKAVQRMRDFLDRYSTPEIADVRIAGGVNGVPGEVRRDQLQRYLKAGIGPDQFHAQQVWKMPRNAKDLFASAGRIESKLVLTGPSNVFNRGPYFRSMFYKEYDRLVMNGVDREVAQELADLSAANHVNSILHRFEEPSRFAAKVDIFMPFQHAREDIARVYGKLLIEHPANAMRLVTDAARLFNDGKDMGIFTKNAYTGQWEMTVPGSGRLSHSLFKLPFDTSFTANIKDMLFVGNGAYGIGFLPQPGGLYWSGIAKLLAEAKPGLFTGKYPLHKWLWGYGPSGNLMSQNTSRLWMAFTGETPPWERLSQDDWKNQHNRWQTEIAQELIYQHRKENPTDAGWFPSQDDVDEATKHFYEAWSFIGTTFPASSYPTLTGENKYWAARNAFTVGGILPWDAQEFLKKYPEFEAFTIGANSKYVGPDDLASLKQFNVGGSAGLSSFNAATGQWENIDPNAGEDYTTEGKLGYRQYRSFTQFKDDFKFYKRTSDYFRLLEDARALQKKNPLQGELSITRLNKDYSDVVNKQRQTYDITAQLYNVNWQYPKALRAQAIARIKNQYGLSNAELQYFMQKAANPLFLPSAWRDARDGGAVDEDVRAHFGNTITGGTPGGNVSQYSVLPINGDVEKYVATLNPAEQANYWKYQESVLGYDPNLDDPNKTLTKYSYFQKQLSSVYNEYPFLLNSNKAVGAATVSAASQFQYPTVKLQATEDSSGGVLKLTPTTTLSRFTTSQVTDSLQQMWNQIAQLYPQYTDGVRLHLLRSNDPKWKSLGGSNALGRGSSQGDVYINIDLLQKDTDAQTARFVLAKELGQANINRFIKTPQQAAAYEKALGLATGKATGASNPAGNPFLDSTTSLKRSPGGGVTNATDWFGRDFAAALGFRSTEATDNFTGAQLQALQAAGVLPNGGTALTNKTYENPFTVAVNKMTGDLNSQVSATYTTIDKVTSEMNAAAQSKNWKAYYALKASRDQLYDVATALHNKFLNKLPDLTQYYDDLHAAGLEGAAGNAKEQEHYLHQAAIDKANAPFYLISEQRRFLNYPPAIQRAYMSTLVQNLDMPAGKSPYDVSQYVKQTTGLSKTFWEYLTPTQQAILEKNFPQYIDRWKYQSDYYLHGAGSKSSSSGSGGGRGGSKSGVPTVLKWAYAQLDKYNHRGSMKRPVAYDAYLKLPANLAVRNQFLDAHPDVSAYIKAGPFGFMPDPVRDQVSSILTMYGKDAVNMGVADYTQNVNVGWAEQQMSAWNRRGSATKPSTYDLWVNMPTGVAKATYLKQHPEIQDWIKLGPMANMPDEYKQVVADIMTRYGEWTQNNDPLGQTITQYFATPGYARSDFLTKHPELEAYWAVTDDSQEKAMSDLQNQYFNIQDVGAKQGFLAAHPELQQHFIDARTKRYEQFLNQVAVYMGANPELFTQYLDRQTDVMAELLRKFAQPNVIREAGPSYVSAATPGPEGGRTRQEQKPPRNRVSA